MLLKLSQTIYTVLLYLYPPDFRRDYGELMQLVFEEACHEAQIAGAWAWIILWRNTAYDLTQSIYYEYKDHLMTEKIHGYEVNATLGEGSAATLYRAYDPQRITQVALKVFNKESNAALLSHMKREGKVHQTLEHPHIPRCYSVVESDEDVCIVMEYINGKTLLEILEERNMPFPVQDVINWGMIACDVLSYLHHQNLVYRDMKPGNLMLSSDGTLYVIDYGITVLSDGDGVAIGTIGYAPPEQYDGIATVQSDIYALGATMHQLLSNRDPRHHPAHSFAEALPGSYNSNISAGLEAILVQALDKDASKRFASADAMKQALLSL